MAVTLTEVTRAQLIQSLVSSFGSGREFADAVYRQGGIRLADSINVDAGVQAVVIEAVRNFEGQERLEGLVLAALKAMPQSRPLLRAAEALGLKAAEAQLVAGQAPRVSPRDHIFRIRMLEGREGYTILARDERGTPGEGRSDELPNDFRRNLPHVQQLLLQGANETRGVIRALNRRADRMTVREMGEDVFKFLMPGEVKALYAEGRRAAAQAGARLRLQIDVTDAPSLAPVPWELAYDPDYGDHLCLTDPTPLCRSVASAVVFQHSDRPLRILGMVAKPRVGGLAEANDTIESEREQTSITRSLETLDQARVTLHWTTSGTRAELRRRLRNPPGGSGGWGVFHFIGHGGLDNARPDGPEGFLLLQEAGGVDPLYASDLKRLMVTPQMTPQLVVLNCCSGAKASPGLPFSSVAARLVQGGIRAVIAMQFEVSERAAQMFSEAFYGQLAEGETIQTALTAARQDICARGISEWVTPALYTSGPDFAPLERAG